MADRQSYPPEQRSNLCDLLKDALFRPVDDDDLSFDQAFAAVALSNLGYDPDEGVTSDGKGDFGIDHWLVEENSATVFQFKSHDFVTDFQPDIAFPPTSLTDVPRIHSFLQNLDTVPKEGNAQVQEFAKELRAAIQRLSLTDQPSEKDFHITIYVCCLAVSLTPQALEEWTRQSGFKEFNYANRRVLVAHELFLIDDLLSEIWRETNTNWRNKQGGRQDWIDLTVEGSLIDAAKSCVFFTKAFDLVEAYEQLGYQIFEPNVRCELKRSKVNEAIRSSIETWRGRREFKHLNNGITLIGSTFQKIRESSSREVTKIKIRQPGVINGLQTVKSIHDGYKELNEEGKDDFAKSCEVLVRLHTRDAVQDYRALVKSTNNQNPMQARNLRSNDPEQINYEKLFASVNWFYERKEGAWQAYRSDSQLWGSLPGKKAANFRPQNGEIRRIDNLDMSQSWLSFLGFSNEAIHNKREIFIDDRYYDIIFRKRVAKHGCEYSYSLIDERVRSDAADQAPSPQLLLLSYLLREIADKLTPSRRQNRDEAVKRLRLESARHEDQDARLAMDAEYTKGLVLAGAKYLFADFVGYILFRALGPRVHNLGPQILRMRSLSALANERDMNVLKGILSAGRYASDDLIPVLWALYNSCCENMISMPVWRQQFDQAAVRSRFNYSEANRTMLLREVESLDKVYQVRPVPRPWSEGFEHSKGIFSYVTAFF